MNHFCGDPYYPACTGCPGCIGGLTIRVDPAPAPVYPEEAPAVPITSTEAPAAQEPTYYRLPESEPEEDPSEAEESEPIELESDPDEGSESHEAGYDYDHIDESDDDATSGASSLAEMMDIDEPTEESDGDSEDADLEDIPLTHDDEGDTTVGNPLTAPTRVIIRSRDEPLPPPSHQVYRHPGGLRWMNTPRKRVPAIQSRDVFRAPLPAPEVPAPPPVRPEWATHLRNWSIDQGMPPPMDLGQSVFELGESSMADRSLPVTVGRIARIGSSLTTLFGLTRDLSQVATSTDTRAQALTIDQHQQEHIVHELREEVEEAHEEIGRLRASETSLRERVEMLVAHMTQMGEQLIAAQEATRRLEERLDRHWI